jgi:hypothetical protein
MANIFNFFYPRALDLVHHFAIGTKSPSELKQVRTGPRSVSVFLSLKYVVELEACYQLNRWQEKTLFLFINLKKET